MKVIVSIHDVTPIYKREVEFIMNKLQGVKKSFLVTPFWHEKAMIDKSFAAMIKKEDLVLHGLTHKGGADILSAIAFLNSNLSRELKGLDKEATQKTITTAVGLFKEYFEKEPAGFIPPMWHHNKYSCAILKEMGFAYTESWTSFIYLQEHVEIKCFPVSFDYGNNTLISNLSFRYWNYSLKRNDYPFLRFTIHPIDIKNGFFNKIDYLIRLLQDKQYTFYTYKDLTG